MDKPAADAFEHQGYSLRADGRVVDVYLADEAGNEHVVEVEMDGGAIVAIGPETTATRWIEANAKLCERIADHVMAHDDDARRVWRRTGVVL